ncbi:nascent polypeptide-associated complex subunit alpha, muscle-specific form-like [Zalophus californianus]|uniref:Nascent polypeptide-associated complex subunit alpha, muscle-specific form-like n=1 Tax=Zalophus californianus TaxID=9704 RepID=A0A6P9F395_ZALCA|nr:nascent polypeptide-associated complex subunit alpha, muscle-specific form-like [Zalophus californianus]
MEGLPFLPAPDLRQKPCAPQTKTSAPRGLPTFRPMGQRPAEYVPQNLRKGVGRLLRVRPRQQRPEAPELTGQTQSQGTCVLCYLSADPQAPALPILRGRIWRGGGTQPDRPHPGFPGPPGFDPGFCTPPPATGGPGPSPLPTVPHSSLCILSVKPAGPGPAVCPPEGGPAPSAKAPRLSGDPDAAVRRTGRVAPSRPAAFPDSPWGPTSVLSSLRPPPRISPDAPTCGHPPRGGPQGRAAAGPEWLDLSGEEEGPGPSIWGPLPSAPGRGGRGSAGRRCPLAGSLGAAGMATWLLADPPHSVLLTGAFYLHAWRLPTETRPPTHGGPGVSQASEAEVGARHIRTPQEGVP